MKDGQNHCKMENGHLEDCKMGKLCFQKLPLPPSDNYMDQSFGKLTLSHVKTGRIMCESHEQRV